MRYASKVAMCRVQIPKLAYDNNTLELWTTCGADDQFSSPKQIRWSTALGKLLVADSSNNRSLVRGSDLSYYSKFYYSVSPIQAIDSDSSYIWHTTLSVIRKIDPISYANLAQSGIIGNGSLRMIDASGDPDYIYVTSNNAADKHGLRLIEKSTMTVKASLLATGTGDGQFTNPLGVFYHGGFAFVFEATRVCKIAVTTTTGAEALTWNTSYAIAALDGYFDGTNWFVIAATTLKKYDASFNEVASVNVVGYSITGIPDQGDGNGATLAITDSTNSHLARYKCSDLTQVGSDVGSSGTGADTICDPQVTGQTGLWFDSEGGNYTVASAANISKNGFSGDFFRATGNIMRYRPTTGGLAAITAIDFNDDKISGEIKNLYKCVNLTSCKLQTNPALVLDLGRLSYKLQTIWAYACGSGIFGSIRHMKAATSINLRENGAGQAQVDQWIDDIWQNRDVMTPGAANFNGSNSAPSGTYQAATPPTTGKEKAYDLVENYGWSMAITS